jgi:hypothetical protein
LAQAYALISIPTASSTILGVFQAIFLPHLSLQVERQYLRCIETIGVFQRPRFEAKRVIASRARKFNTFDLPWNSRFSR